MLNEYIILLGMTKYGFHFTVLNNVLDIIYKPLEEREVGNPDDSFYHAQRLIISLIPTGAFLGSFMSTFLIYSIKSHRFLIFLAEIIDLIGWMLVSFADSAVGFVVGRFISGIGVGLDVTLAQILYRKRFTRDKEQVSEFSAKSLNYQLFIVMGNFIGTVTGMIIKEIYLNDKEQSISPFFLFIPLLVLFLIRMFGIMMPNEDREESSGDNINLYEFKSDSYTSYFVIGGLVYILNQTSCINLFIFFSCEIFKTSWRIDLLVAFIMVLATIFARFLSTIFRKTNLGLFFSLMIILTLLVLNYIVQLDIYHSFGDISQKIDLDVSPVILFLYIGYLVFFQVSWGSLSFSIVCEICHDLSIISSTMIQWLFCIVSGLNFPDQKNLKIEEVQFSFFVFLIIFVLSLLVLLYFKNSIDAKLNNDADNYALTKEYNAREIELKNFTSSKKDEEEEKLMN